MHIYMHIYVVMYMNVLCVLVHVFYLSAVIFVYMRILLRESTCEKSWIEE